MSLRERQWCGTANVCAERDELEKVTCTERSVSEAESRMTNCGPRRLGSASLFEGANVQLTNQSLWPLDRSSLARPVKVTTLVRTAVNIHTQSFLVMFSPTPIAIEKRCPKWR